MKTIYYLFFGALLLLTGSFSLNAQVNVPNGNFEQASTDGNIPNWGNELTTTGVKWVGVGSNSIDDVVFKEGKHSGYITGGGAMNWIGNIPGNKTYDISFWFRSDASVQNGVTPTVYMQGTRFVGGTISTADLSKLNTPHDAVVGEWVFVEIKGIKSPDTMKDWVIGIASNYNGFWVDDVKIVEATGIKTAQTITFADITKQLGDADFTLSAKASSYLPVSYTIADATIATITNGTVHLLKAGSTTITASQAGDNAYEAAPDVTVALTVTAKPVAAAEVPNGNFEQVDTDGNIASWGLDYNNNWDGIAGTVSADKAVFKEGKQSGYFTSRTGLNYIKNFPGNKTYDISFWFRSNAPAGTKPGISLSGTLLVSGAQFSQEDNDKLNVSHEAVAGEWLFVEVKGIKFPDITDDFALYFQGNNDGFWLDDVRIVEAGTSTKTAQTITGLSAITKTTGDADFDLTATASSNLAVTYTSSNTAVATVSGSKVHIVGAGTSTITASQAGDGTYAAAPDVTATLTVNKAAQTISGLSDISKKVGDADFILAATATSTLPVAYSIADATVATVTNGLVHILKAGSTTITAAQAGNDNFSAATAVTATLTVNKAAQTINGLSDISKKVGDADFALAATATSTLPVTYSIADATVATVTNGLVHILKAGSTTITATQAGNDNYSAATAITATLTVIPATGIDQVESNTIHLNVYPNPVTVEVIAVTLSEAGQKAVIHLTDLAGRTLMQQAVSTGSTTATLSIAGLSKGIYLIKYTDNEGKRATVKMIKY